MYVSLRQPNMYNMLITTTLTSKIDILNIANKKRSACEKSPENVS